MSQPYYETMYILRPDIPEEEVETHVTKYRDLVTEADHAAEAAVLAVLAAETPAIGVLAEESGRQAKPGDLEWCVDPLDGTTNYAHRYPFFATSIGLTCNGMPLLGALAAPALAALMSASPETSALVERIDRIVDGRGRVRVEAP